MTIMTDFSDVCWVGPLGSMKPLPDVAPSSAVSVPVTRVGAIHRSLAGGLTVDTFARKRAWTWAYDMLLEPQTVYLEALQYGTVPGPLRLIDPRRPNRLPEDVASGGSTSKSTTMFYTDNGSALYYHPLSDAGSAPLSTLGPGAMLSGMQEWLVMVPSVSGNFVHPRDPRWGDNRWRTPVVPGETITFSAWVLAPTSCSVDLEVAWFDGAGAMTAVVVAPITAMNPASWTELTGSLPVPDGAVACLPYLATTATYCRPSTSIYTTGWSVTNGLGAPMPIGITHHCGEPEELAGGWRIGGGAPYVVADVAGATYPRPGFYGGGLTLYES